MWDWFPAEWGEPPRNGAVPPMEQAMGQRADNGGTLVPRMLSGWYYTPCAPRRAASAAASAAAAAAAARRRRPPPMAPPDGRGPNGAVLVGFAATGPPGGWRCASPRGGGCASPNPCRFRPQASRGTRGVCGFVCATLVVARQARLASCDTVRGSRFDA